MAVTTITAEPALKTGYNLTDSADFTTMSTEAGNGVSFDFDRMTFIVLKNTTGGNATFTLKLKSYSGLSDYSVTPTDPTIVLATGKTMIVKVGEELKNSEGNVVIECDVAADILVVSI